MSSAVHRDRRTWPAQTGAPRSHALPAGILGRGVRARHGEGGGARACSRGLHGCAPGNGHDLTKELCRPTGRRCEGIHGTVSGYATVGRQPLPVGSPRRVETGREPPDLGRLPVSAGTDLGAHWSCRPPGASGRTRRYGLVALSNIVLVGVDGSPESGAALKYAVAEANRRGARLRVVSTYFPEYSLHGRTQPLSVSEAAIEVDVEAQIRRMVEEALAGNAVAPPVEIVAAAGPPAGVLIDMSGEVDVLVVGHRGRGGFASMLLGSVGLQCVLHAN